jgi:hypothetical protein
LNSCLKSNLFKDAATSPKLDRLVKLFSDADLRNTFSGNEAISAMKFPLGLSSSPSFDETVHADESDFVDCGKTHTSRNFKFNEIPFPITILFCQYYFCWLTVFAFGCSSQAGFGSSSETVSICEKFDKKYSVQAID